MPKTALKTKILPTQSNRCALSDEPLSSVNLSLVDTDRIKPKADGGTYTTDNTRIVNPVAHMKRHNIYRERSEALDNLKTLVDDRQQFMKLYLKINNQLLAYKRHTDVPNEDTINFLQEQLRPIKQRLAAADYVVEKAIYSYDDPLVQVSLNVPGLGSVTVAALTVYVDLSKASTPSALWKYAGLHCASHERYRKGTSGGGNSTLRTVLWNTANYMMRDADTAYRQVYTNAKTRYEHSERIVRSRNTEGKPVDVMWKDTKPSHRHGAALRAVMKHILADYWMVGRTLKGLEVKHLYVDEILHHTDIISPESRGWDLTKTQVQGMQSGSRQEIDTQALADLFNEF